MLVARIPEVVSAVVVDDVGTKFLYGTDDIVNTPGELYTYTVDDTPVGFAWEDWEPFYLYPGYDGTITIDSTAIVAGKTPMNKIGAFRTPFNGPDQTTIVQAASISSGEYQYCFNDCVMSATS